MKKHITLALALVAVLSFSFTNDKNAPEKINICHTPPGNPDNCHEITISVDALDTHKDHHGDALICRNATYRMYYQGISNNTGIPVEFVY